MASPIKATGSQLNRDIKQSRKLNLIIATWIRRLIALVDPLQATVGVKFFIVTSANRVACFLAPIFGTIGPRQLTAGSRKSRLRSEAAISSND